MRIIQPVTALHTAVIHHCIEAAHHILARGLLLQILAPFASNQLHNCTHKWSHVLHFALTPLDSVGGGAKGLTKLLLRCLQHGTLRIHTTY
jgi:hypothetical protein